MLLLENIVLDGFRRGHRAYYISEEGKFYLIKYKEVLNDALPYNLQSELQIYNDNGRLEQSISLSDIDKDMSDFYLIQEDDSRSSEAITGVYVKENQIIITTENNRLYVYQDGQLYVKHAYDQEKIIERFDDIKAQTKNMAGHLFEEKEGRIFLLSQGNPFGKFNRRDRYIVSLSEEKFKGFDSAIIPSFYLADVWKNLLGKEGENDLHHGIWIPGMKFRTARNDLQKRVELYDPMIFQVLDLDKNNCLLSIFTDSRSKSAYPNKYTPYYFIILNKQDGSIVNIIKPRDASVYKDDYHYLLVDDKKNNRFLFKTYNFLYSYDYMGNLLFTLDLSENKLSRFKKLRLIGMAKEMLYCYHPQKEKVIGIVVPADLELLIGHIKEAIKVL